MSIINIIKKEEISIEKDEVLRYLQYKNQEIDSSFLKRLDESIEKVKSIITPKAIYGIYPIKYIDNKIKIEGTNLIIESNDIKKLLKDCKSCILMAVTIGCRVDKEIRKEEYEDLSNSLIMDAVATTFVEKICDYIEELIKKESINKNLTMRYSPGYGDLSIDYGKEILNILESQRIGITLNNKGIMIPRKSVNAVIGVYSYENKNILKNPKKSCYICNNYNNCRYKKDIKNTDFDK